MSQRLSGRRQQSEIDSAITTTMKRKKGSNALNRYKTRHAINADARTAVNLHHTPDLRNATSHDGRLGAPGGDRLTDS